MVVTFKIICLSLFKLLLFSIFLNNHHIFIISKIVIPFSTYDSNPNSFIMSYSDNFLYSEITAGSYNSSPNGKKIAIFLNFRNYQFLISPRKICPSTSFYNIKDSLTYNSKDGLSYDNFYFYTDIQGSTMKKLEQIPFKYSEGTVNDIYCGDMGFNLVISKDSEKENIIYNLKDKKYIQEFYLSFKFDKIQTFDDYKNLKGKIIIGELPHIYDKNKYDKEQYIEDNSFFDDNPLDMYRLKFDKIFIGLKNSKKTSIQNNENILIKFEINYGLISGPDYYKDFIELIFFNKSDIVNLCSKSIDSGSLISYDIYVCESDIKSKFNSFPEISFYSQKFDYNFTFTYEDLFMLKNNKYYFKVIFVGGGYNMWRFGLPFLLKYNLIFNQDSKTIGFYNENIIVSKKDKNNSIINKPYFWIILFVVIVGIIVGITLFIIKNLKAINRKKKANELDDGFDYEPHKDKENNDHINNEDNEINKNKLFENEENN